MAVQLEKVALDNGLAIDNAYFRIDRVFWFKSGIVEYEVLGYVSASDTDKDPIYRETLRTKDLDISKPLLDQVYADFHAKIEAEPYKPAAGRKEVPIAKNDPILMVDSSKLTGAPVKV